MKKQLKHLDGKDVELTAVEAADISRAQAEAQAEATRQRPLSPDGVAATLNAVLGNWTLTDAANAVNLSEQDLINEALAWGVGTETKK